MCLEVKYDKVSYEEEIERLKSDFRIDNLEIYGVGGFQEPYTTVPFMEMDFIA